MTIERSKKVKALQKVFERPWWQVALTASAEPITQAQIADRWTAAVRLTYPNIRYSQQDVCRILARARAQAEPFEVVR